MSSRKPGPESKRDQGGTIIRGADGALYFIRDEVLEETRLPRDLVKQAEILLREPEKHEKDFRLGESPRIEVLGRVDGRVGVAGQGFRVNIAAASTVMCPSFLFSRSIDEEIINPQLGGLGQTKKG